MQDTRTADDIVTLVTEAPTRTVADSAIRTVRSRALLASVADLLYVEWEGHGPERIRRDIVDAARDGVDESRAQRTRATR